MAAINDFAEFIDSIKNLVITIMISAMAFYMAMFYPDGQYTPQFVTLALTGIGVYVGHRVEAAKPK
jgi:hypothetical protein